MQGALLLGPGRSFNDVPVLSLRSVVARVAKLLLDCVRGTPTLHEGGGPACARVSIVDSDALRRWSESAEAGSR